MTTDNKSICNTFLKGPQMKPLLITLILMTCCVLIYIVKGPDEFSVIQTLPFTNPKSPSIFDIAACILICEFLWGLSRIKSGKKANPTQGDYDQEPGDDGSEDNPEDQS